jgi:hypothetical protein
MTPYIAYSIAVGLRVPKDIDEVADAVAFLEDHPELLTSGEACRGFERLRDMLFVEAG